jgi:4-amino-4-deoxy-L-arabinose transferase-like glycosyltransferase
MKKDIGLDTYKRKGNNALILAIVGFALGVLFFLLDNDIIPFKYDMPYLAVSMVFAGFVIILGLLLFYEKVKKKSS